MSAKVPRRESSWANSLRGTKVPGSEKARERKGQGAKVPGRQLAMFLLADSLQGANWPGSEKAMNPILLLSICHNLACRKLKLQGQVATNLTVRHTSNDKMRPAE